MCTALVVLAPAPAAAAARPDGEDRVRIGPLKVSETRRRRVRGGRPDGASVHVAWAAGAHDPGAADREALAGFERAAFPEGSMQRTIIDAPPDPWMADLTLPDIPVRWNKKTVEYLRYFRDDPKGKAMIRGWMRRAGRYADRMAKVLGEAEVPTALVMVAMAESGFNPTVRSRVGAAGAWQFMAGTGQVYGLSQDFWEDERFDIEKSTLAAALYLKDLRVRFGSWELALAAYNAGYGLVMTTIERHNTNNYWSLCEIESGLPYATTNYAPKIIAAALVRANPEAFAVDAATINPLPAADWVQVRVQKSTRIDMLATLLDVDPDLLFELNAQLLRRRTPPTDAPYPVRIPRDKAGAFASAQPALAKAWASETTHAVKTGEKLESIARKHGTTAKALRKLNGIRDSAEVKGGVTLVVPAKPKPSASAAADAPELPLAAVTDITPPAGHRLVFFETTRATTPRDVERAFGVTWPDVIDWNDLDPHARVQAGQVLQLAVTNAFDAATSNVVAHELHEVEYVVRGSRAHLEASLRRRGKVRRGYKVRSGDTLAKVGRRFDLSLGDLARINHFSRRHDPKPGSTLVVYVEKGKTGGTVKAPPPRGFEDPAPPDPTRAPSTADTARVPNERPKSTAPAAKAEPAPKAKPGRAPSTADTSRVPGAKR
ncbi:MAG: LysM peptidoglycan-binding domain-containing protein [Myxococcota bacterium]